MAEPAKLITEDAFTVDMGHTELELGYALGHVRRTFDSSNSLIDRQTSIGQIVAIQATHGVTAEFDVAVAASWIELIRDDSNEPADTLGNVVVRGKWTFLTSENGQVGVAWVPGLTFPFHVDNLDETVSVGQDFESLDNLLAVTYLSQRLSSSFDLGYSHPIGDRRGGQHGIFVTSAGAGYQVEPWLQPILEVSYSHGLISGPGADSDYLAITLGAILDLSDSVRLDIGVQQGVFGRNSDSVTEVLTNLSITF